MWRWLLVTGSDMVGYRSAKYLLLSRHPSRPPGAGVASGGDGGKPAAVLLGLAGHRLEESFLDARRDRPARPFADRAPVDFADRGYFRRGAGEKGFVCDVQIVASDAPRGNLVTHLARKRDHRLARDADERARQLGLVEAAVLHHEEVFAGAFRDETVDVEEEPLVVAVLGGFEIREDRVRIRAGVLRAAHRDVHVMPRERGGLHADAFFYRVGAEVRAPRPRGDRDVHARAFG